jgi:dolichol-phosphate mannosyltransferase
MNEANGVLELIKQVKVNLELCSNDFEIILIDDGSKDNTWKQILFAADDDLRVKGVKLSNNFGQHFAITAGLEKSSGEWTVVMDGDLQDRPEAIPLLLEKAKHGFDIVYVRRQSRPESLFYKIGQRTFYFILNVLSDNDFDSKRANYSILNRKVVEAFRMYPEKSRFFPTIISSMGFSSTTIDFNHGRRYKGTTSYSLNKRIKLGIDILVSNSERPLKISLLLSFILFVSSIISLLLGAINQIRNEFFYVENLLIGSLILFVGSTILFSLGIIGIYLSKIYKEVRFRPLYVISETKNFEIS